MLSLKDTIGEEGTVSRLVETSIIAIVPMSYRYRPAAAAGTGLALGGGVGKEYQLS